MLKRIIHKLFMIIMLRISSALQNPLTVSIARLPGVTSRAGLSFYGTVKIVASTTY